MNKLQEQYCFNEIFWKNKVFVMDSSTITHSFRNYDVTLERVLDLLKNLSKPKQNITPTPPIRTEELNSASKKLIIKNSSHKKSSKENSSSSNKDHQRDYTQYYDENHLSEMIACLRTTSNLNQFVLINHLISFFKDNNNTNNHQEDAVVFATSLVEHCFGLLQKRNFSLEVISPTLQSYLPICLTIFEHTKLCNIEYFQSVVMLGISTYLASFDKTQQLFESSVVNIHPKWRGTLFDVWVMLCTSLIDNNRDEISKQQTEPC